MEVRSSHYVLHGLGYLPFPRRPRNGRCLHGGGCHGCGRHGSLGPSIAGLTLGGTGGWGRVVLVVAGGCVLVGG